MHKEVTCALEYLFAILLNGRGISLASIFQAWRGLEDSKQDVKVGDMAKEYYKTTCEVVDPNHLILGDRFNGNKGIPNRVLDAMRHHVDVLSVRSISVSRIKSRECVW